MPKREHKLKEILLADPLWLVTSVKNNVVSVKYPDNPYSCLKINHPSTTPEAYIGKQNQTSHAIDLRGMFFKITQISDESEISAKQCSATGDLITNGLTLKFNPEDLIHSPQLAFRTRYLTKPQLTLMNFTDPDLEPAVPSRQPNHLPVQHLQIAS